jgi:hypothetical protein
VVTAAARRAAVTAAQQAHGISERRACRIIRADRRRSATARGEATIRRRESGCVSLPVNGAGSVTGGCIYCWPAREL